MSMSKSSTSRFVKPLSSSLLRPALVASRMLSAVTVPNSRNLYDSSERNLLLKSTKVASSFLERDAQEKSNLRQIPPTSQCQSHSAHGPSRMCVRQSIRWAFGECTAVYSQPVSRICQRSQETERRWATDHLP